MLEECFNELKAIVNANYEGLRKVRFNTETINLIMTAVDYFDTSSFFII